MRDAETIRSHRTLPSAFRLPRTYLAIFTSNFNHSLVNVSARGARRPIIPRLKNPAMRIVAARLPTSPDSGSAFELDHPMIESLLVRCFSLGDPAANRFRIIATTSRAARFGVCFLNWN